MSDSEGGGGGRCHPRSLLRPPHFARGRRVRALNGSLTIIVLTPLTTFSMSCARAAWKAIGKRMNSLGYFYRDVGSSKGPPQARGCFARSFGMPCADRLRCALRACPNGHSRPVPPGARWLCDGAEFAAAQDRRQDPR